MQTYFPKGKEIGEKEKKWYVVDATDAVLGRLSTFIADILSGKNKPDYTPHLDMGEYVIVINADKVRLTGKKWDDKVYYRHTGYLGNLKSSTARELLNKHPERIIEHSVKGMLPRGPLGRAVFKKLKIYAAPDHPHKAQKPIPIELTGKRG